ncbi:MAG: hydrogenase [Methanomassiliicoccus sp.]|jgi:hydrogenase-4 component E|nr:hydrogenase [Methanomassiliicoccus sp.]
MAFSTTTIIDGLAAAILLTTFIAIASNRMFSLVRLFALQSVALGLLAMSVASITGAGHIYAVAVLTIGIKGVVIPWMLLYVMDKIRTTKEVEPLVSIPLSLLLCGVLTAVAFYITEPIIFTSGTITTITKNCLAISLAVVLIGFYTMIARKKAVTQIMGLLTMENGLFLAAISVTYGMPMIVELGIFFDILVAVLIMGMFAFRINKTFDSVDTTILRRLHD